MAYFTADFIDFFKELAANNHKDWFDANRKRYKQSVQEPFKSFVQEMINRARAEDPAIDIEPKDAIFRINRDIRFSADKTPYKTNVSAIIGPGGKKNKEYPGMYVELGPEAVSLYGGAYLLEKDRLQRLREYIASHPKEFEKAINDPGFKKHFGQIHGEQNKRLPKELQSAAENQPLIFNNQFYYYTTFPPDLATKAPFPDKLMEAHQAAKPVRGFLIKGMGL